MKVFVTGATGFIGSAVVRELIEAGHQVLGLARSDASAAKVASAGAEVHRGALNDLDSLRSGAAAADGVIHLAYIHDFSDGESYESAARTDLHAVQTIGAALEGSGKPFVITSGTAMLTFFLPPGRLGTEEDVADPGSVAPRVASENATLALAERGVRSSVVRLAPSVHGKEDAHGFVPSLISIARAKGVSGYVDDGSNRWPAVHQLDAVRLFRLALEKAPAGSVLHGAADEGVPLRAIAEVIGRHLDLPVVSIAPENAVEHFGWMGTVVSVDNPASSARTRELLEWQPVHPSLISDLEEGHYFHHER
jgi:nucleoside-diphosphate-sugar epimerase